MAVTSKKQVKSLLKVGVTVISSKTAIASIHLEQNKRTTREFRNAFILRLLLLGKVILSRFPPSRD